MSGYISKWIHKPTFISKHYNDNCCQYHFSIKQCNRVSILNRDNIRVWNIPDRQSFLVPVSANAQNMDDYENVRIRYGIFLCVQSLTKFLPVLSSCYTHFGAVLERVIVTNWMYQMDRAYCFTLLSRWQISRNGYLLVARTIKCAIESVVVVRKRAMR